MSERDVISTRERLKENRFLYFLTGCVRSLIHHAHLFLHSFGFMFASKTDDGGMPVPPPGLRYRVHGELRRDSFLAAGSQIHRDTSRILEAQKIELSEELEVLDFGCGCARVLAHFFCEDTKWKFTGTDIDSDAIDWARKNFPGKASWDINDKRPPLPYASRRFDVVFAISLFTHFDEDMQFDWLQELHRVLSVDGILICSVHGKPVWDKATPFGNRLHNVMNGKGFYFLQSNSGIRNLAGLPDFYQTAFHSEEYVRNNWGDLFHIVDYSDCAIGNHQTAVVLRKKEFMTSGNQGKQNTLGR